jgi:hypothetical protein
MAWNLYSSTISHVCVLLLSFRYFLAPGKSKTKAAAAKKAEKVIQVAKPRASISLFGGGQEEKKAAAKKAEKLIQGAKPRASISLFGGGQGEKKAAPPKKQQKKAPSGVPSLARWKENDDGTVTGFISGSSSFDEGERVTTSPIASGKVTAGQVVRTGSGSKYFLS